MAPIQQCFGVSSRSTWHEIEKKPLNGSFEGFCRALAVWINKPHVINRRLSGAQILISSLTSQRLNSSGMVSFLQEFCDLEGSQYRGKMQKSPTCCKKVDEIETDSETSKLTVDLENLDLIHVDSSAAIVRDLHPKQVDRYVTLREAIVLDKKLQAAVFCPVYQYQQCSDNSVNSNQKTSLSPVQNEISYRVSFQSNTSGNWLSLEYCQVGIEHSTTVVSKETKPQSHVTVDWLKDVLLTKLCRWSSEENLRTGVSSLKLVPVDKYSVKYLQLKQKYGPDLVKVWPDNTDPQKFVYEDIAIATYLLLLWEKEREASGTAEKQSFVDLGCGNGLLVYLLTKEGHRGVGIDVRKRQIWDYFGSSINLQERSLTPSDNSLFPDYDWLIGNHSDELTPWIPVMAARSAYSCRYFVLPCCHHDFNRKFSGKSPGQSRYRTYLDFVQDVGRVCGFEVQEDTLRIPSTKRVCFIGQTRTYPKDNEVEIDLKIKDFITQRCGPIVENNSCEGLEERSHNENESETKRAKLSHPAVLQQTGSKDNIDPGSTAWAGKFEPRSSEEKVRNCRDVERGIKEEIVQTVFEKVLSSDKDEMKITSDGRTWRKGGSLPLPEAAALFEKDVLQKLKSECGGIQTLLRNHHYIFQVVGGVIQLRDTSVPRPARRSAKKNSRKPVRDLTKTFLCWFNEHHPDGCPGTAPTCLYAHGQHELRNLNNITTSS